MPPRNRNSISEAIHSVHVSVSIFFFSILPWKCSTVFFILLLHMCVCVNNNKQKLWPYILVYICRKKMAPWSNSRSLSLSRTHTWYRNLLAPSFLYKQSVWDTKHLITMKNLSNNLRKMIAHHRCIYAQSATLPMAMLCIFGHTHKRDAFSSFLHLLLMLLAMLRLFIMFFSSLVAATAAVVVVDSYMSVFCISFFP